MNQIEVGNKNQGIVAGRDVTINPEMPMPCKNGDGWLSKTDYERLPYCNSCIRKSHAMTHKKFYTIAIFLGVLTVVIYFLIVQEMPNFFEFFFANGLIPKEMLGMLSSLVLSVIILYVYVKLFKFLANQYNKSVYPLHK